MRMYYSHTRKNKIAMIRKFIPSDTDVCCRLIQDCIENRTYSCLFAQILYYYSLYE